MKKILVTFILLTLMSCSPADKQQHPEYDFTLAFMTDIHLQLERKASEGLAKAIDTMNALTPDFLITGGDMIMDALRQTWQRSDSLYSLYKKIMGKAKCPVYTTMGNHEVYGWQAKVKDIANAEYGKQMYEHRLAKRYYKFTHKGWIFYILDSVVEDPELVYRGYIDSMQIEWLRDDLKNVPHDKPICISTHIPLVSVQHVYRMGPGAAIGPKELVSNSPQLLELFRKHNLRLVLQGHLHYLEHIKTDGIDFITGGAVSARWWTGPRDGMQEGFLMLKVRGDNVEYEYIDFEWESENKE